MANSDREVISFDYALEKSTKTKRSNFYTGSWKVFTGRVANWILENPDQVLVLMKEIMTGNSRA